MKPVGIVAVAVLVMAKLGLGPLFAQDDAFPAELALSPDTPIGYGMKTTRTPSSNSL